MPTPGSLRKLVHDLLMKRLLDGQFEESGLTLTELHIIEESAVQGADRAVPLAHQVSRSRSGRRRDDAAAPTQDARRTGTPHNARPSRSHPAATQGRPWKTVRTRSPAR